MVQPSRRNTIHGVISNHDICKGYWLLIAVPLWWKTEICIEDYCFWCILYFQRCIYCFLPEEAGSCPMKHIEEAISNQYPPPVIIEENTTDQASPWWLNHATFVQMYLHMQGPSMYVWSFGHVSIKAFFFLNWVLYCKNPISFSCVRFLCFLILYLKGMWYQWILVEGPTLKGPFLPNPLLRVIKIVPIILRDLLLGRTFTFKTLKMEKGIIIT